MSIRLQNHRIQWLTTAMRSSTALWCTEGSHAHDCHDTHDLLSASAPFIFIVAQAGSSL